MKTNAREKKILYGGIAIAAAILIYYAATSFSSDDGESLVDKVTKQENMLRRQRELVEREDFYKKQIEEAEKDLEKIQTRLFPGNNTSAAATELQRIIEGFAERSGVVIMNKTPRAAVKIADSDTLTKISILVGLDCQLEDLVDFLIVIENYDKFLKVEEITIGTQPMAPQRQMVISRPLNVLISGYINVPPPEAKLGEGMVQTSFSQGR